MNMSEFKSMINWYPGHMAKSRRLLLDQVSRVDLVIELCDSRLPSASRNPDLTGIAANKKRLLFLNKSDLADPEQTEGWLRYFRGIGIEAYTSCALSLRSKETLSCIDKASREIVQKALDKGVRKTVRAMVIGIPNVGKSTFINRLCGRAIAKTGDRPGVTRANQWVKVSPYLELLDTPGMLWPKLDDQEAAVRMCYIGSVKDDVIDLEGLAIHLLEDLCRIVPEQVQARFHIPDISLKGVDLLDAVCAGRGWLLKGNQYDYDRCCNIVLDEFRAGKLGRVTFEAPPYTIGEEKKSE